jgi:hypothetical protein
MSNVGSIANNIYSRLMELKFDFINNYKDIKKEVEDFNSVYTIILEKLSQVKKEEKERILVRISSILEKYKDLRINSRLIEVSEIIEKISKLNKELKNLI